MQLTPAFLKNPNLQFVMGVLGMYNGEAYIVGGCVRDAAIGMPVNDIDIATDHTPDEVRSLFKDHKNVRMVPTGIEHGTWTLVVGEDSFEVTTYRRDVETDGRRATVAFADTMEEDAARRDFTMNALYMDAQGNVSDPTGRGISDLMVRAVRFVGDADERCREDYLRILRLFRFHAHYGVGPMDAAAFASARNNAAGLKKISGERIWSELKKTLSAHNPTDALNYMTASGVLTAILPKHTPVWRVARLVQSERECGVGGGSWERRLVTLCPTMRDIPFPCSKAETQYIQRLVTLSPTGKDAADVAFVTKDLIMAVDCFLINRAENGSSNNLSISDLTRGKAAVCPITPEYLQENGYEPGKRLGDALRFAMNLFRQSGLTADRKTIMDQLSCNYF